MLMDLAFPLVYATRKEVKIKIEYESVSEEELIEDNYFIWIFQKQNTLHDISIFPLSVEIIAPGYW